jgi:hypothetical protein
MRFGLLACVLGCGGAPPVAPTPPAKIAKQEEFWSPKKPKEPPLVRLALNRRYFIMTTEAGVTSCRGWQVEQSENVDDDMAFLVDGDETIGFVNHGNELELRSRTRKLRKHPDATTPCGGSFYVQELDDGLDVSGARWFDHEAACTEALAKGERLATDFATCEWRTDANLQQQAASQRRFEAMLRNGGTAFTLAGDRCQPIHARPSQRAGGALRGELGVELRAGALRGRSSFTYELVPNDLTITLLGPHTEWSDGTGIGMLCGDDHPLIYGRDSVEVAETIYLTPQACRSALDHAKKRSAFLPRADTDDRAIAAASPSLGGC